MLLDSQPIHAPGQGASFRRGKRFVQIMPGAVDRFADKAALSLEATGLLLRLVLIADWRTGIVQPVTATDLAELCRTDRRRIQRLLGELSTAGALEVNLTRGHDGTVRVLIYDELVCRKRENGASEQGDLLSASARASARATHVPRTRERPAKTAPYAKDAIDARAPIEGLDPVACRIVAAFPDRQTEALAVIERLRASNISDLIIDESIGQAIDAGAYAPGWVEKRALARANGRQRTLNLAGLAAQPDADAERRRGEQLDQAAARRRAEHDRNRAQAVPPPPDLRANLTRVASRA